MPGLWHNHKRLMNIQVAAAWGGVKLFPIVPGSTFDSPTPRMGHVA
jgi:hypothetical protein